MAGIRELTTVFDFKVDQSGIRQYEAVVTKIKGLALEAGKMFGLYFAVDKIGEFVGETVKAAKEMNRINIQISQLIRGSDDLVTIQESLFNTAQKLGVSYNEIADTFRDFLNDSQDSKISQEELLAATENVSASLMVGRASAEQQAEAMSAINRALRMGKVGPRQIGVLLDTPGLRQFLSEVGGGDEALRELVKSGKFTGEKLVEYLSKPSRRLAEDFAKVPQTLGRVFDRINNDMAKSISNVWKMTRGFEQLGKVLWWFYQSFRSVVSGIINMLGGWQLALQYVGIALALVIGPWAIRQAYLMAARLAAIAIASWSIVLPWTLIGAAVLFAAGMIQDFFLWMKGGKTKTIFGDWLGPFEDFQKKMAEFAENSPMFAFLRAIREALAGNWAGAIDNLKESLSSVQGVLGIILDLVAVAIPVAFAKWTLISFANLVASLMNVKKVAAETAAAVEGVAGGGKTPPGISKGAGFLPWLGRLSTWLLPLMLSGDQPALTPDQKKALDERNRREQEQQGKSPEDINRKYGYTGNLFDDVIQMFKNMGSGIAAPATEPPPGSFQWMWNQWKGQPQSSAFPQVSPFADKGGGAAAPVVAPTNNVTVSPTYNITATMQPDEQFMADMIQQRVQDSTGQMARQLQDAIPRTERQTQ